MAVTQTGFHETLINNFFGALDGGINDTDTTITLVDATGLPTEGYFRLKIGSEIVYCRGRSGNDVLVAERGAEGTSAASHLTGADANAVITAGSMQRYLLDGMGAPYTEDITFADSHGWPVPLGRMADENKGSLDVSDFTWFNQGSATASDSAGGIIMTCPAEANFNLRGKVIAVPSTPYCFTTRLRLGIAPHIPIGSDSSAAGLVIRESSTTEMITLQARAGWIQGMWEWNSPTSFGSVVDTNVGFQDIQYLWLRIEDDGTNHKGYFSLDGSNWSNDGSAWWQQGRTSHMASGGDQIGFFVNAGPNAGNFTTGPATFTAYFDCFSIEEL